MTTFQIRRLLFLMFKNAHRASGIPSVLSMPDGQKGVSAKAKETK